MHIDPFKTSALCHIERRKYVVNVAVNAAVGQKSEDVQRLAAALCIVHRLDVGGIFKEAAVLYRIAYAGQILKNDSAGADVRMSDLGVAHLPLRQSDRHSGSGKRRIRVLRKYRIEPRRCGSAYRIAVGRRSNAEAVHYHKYGFTHFPHLPQRLSSQSQRALRMRRR